LREGVLSLAYEEKSELMQKPICSRRWGGGRAVGMEEELGWTNQASKAAENSGFGRVP